MAKPLDDTGWKAPEIVTTPQGTAGVIQMPSEVEATPCFLCKHWHKDQRKLMQFIRSRGLVPDSNGIYTLPTPDLPNRKSIQVDPKDWGFCLTLAMPTHMNAGAQCEYWQQRQVREDMRGIIK
jgi:hypothetical protein